MKDDPETLSPNLLGCQDAESLAIKLENTHRTMEELQVFLSQGSNTFLTLKKSLHLFLESPQGSEDARL